MEWRQCVGFPDFEVSEEGDVRRLTRGGRRYPVGYALKPKPHQRGYVRYSLNCRDVLAHRLVAEAFLGPAEPGFEVAHQDGSRTNNRISNLRWVTPKENQADRKRHGTYHEGERCSSSKLSDAAVQAIRSKYLDGGRRYVGGAVLMKDIAQEHGVSLAQVSRIVNGRQRTGNGMASRPDRHSSHD